MNLNNESEKNNACRKIGSKWDVYHGNASKTAGGLCKDDLLESNGKIVSKKRHEQGKKAIENLKKSREAKKQLQQEEQSKNLPSESLKEDMKEEKKEECLPQNQIACNNDPESFGFEVEPIKEDKAKEIKIRKRINKKENK